MNPQAIIFLALNVFAFLVMLPAHAYEQMIEDHVTFDDARSVEQGCLLAEHRMKRAAIEAQCGSQIHGGRMRVWGEEVDLLSTFHLENTQGLVTAWSQIDRKVSDLSREGVNAFRCDLKARVEVQCTEGERDSRFLPIQATLNQQSFAHGEDLKITIQPTATTRYLTILQWIPEAPPSERLQLIFPNQIQSEQIILQNETKTLPEHHRWITKLPPEREMAEESLLLVTTKYAPSLPPEKMSEEGFYSWLSDIPLAARRELVLPYLISR